MSTKPLGDSRKPWPGLAVAALWVLPLWATPFPPMVDYPQQLSLAAILRWYGDPSRRFQETYELALWAPHGLFKLLVAGLAWVLPINVAGRLVVSLSLAAVGAAALALCRRAGRPAVYALLALAFTYNYAFFWGFVDNLLAYPLALGGVALADALFDRPFTSRSWLALAGVGILFYTVHLQFLLLFAGAVGWIALCRRPDWRRLALWLSALIPGVAVGLAAMAYGVLRSPAGVITNYELRMRQAPPVRLPVLQKLARIPETLFGPTGDWKAWASLWLLLAVVGLALAFRTRDSESPDSLKATRFATLAGWLAFLYLVLPEFRGGYLIAQRIAPFAAMVAVAALPVPRPDRRRLIVGAAAALVVFQLGQTLLGFLRFRDESAGLYELLAGTEPGESLAGLVFERSSASWPGMAVYLHFPAYYQVFKGGRILFSFAELFQTSARFRPGRSWDDLLSEWNEWSPRLFNYERHAGRFRYFLLRGDLADVAAAFKREPAELGLSLKRSGRWWLFERPDPARPAFSAAWEPSVPARPAVRERPEGPEIDFRVSGADRPAAANDWPVAASLRPASRTLSPLSARGQPAGRRRSPPPATHSPAPASLRPPPADRSPPPATRRPAPASLRPTPASRWPLPASRRPLPARALRMAASRVEPVETTPRSFDEARPRTSRALDKRPRLWHNADPSPRASFPGRPRRAPSKVSPAVEGALHEVGRRCRVLRFDLRGRPGTSFGRIHECLKPTWLRGRALPW